MTAPRHPVPMTASDSGRPDLVPFRGEGAYSPRLVAERRDWVARRAGCGLDLVGASALPTESLRGNVENLIGSVQVPLGVAGPLVVRGEQARGTFYVPLATTEGALVRSYERGMVALTRAGGAAARVVGDENRVAPVFLFDDIEEAVAFARAVPDALPALRAAAESTTRHGRLLRVESHAIGREVFVSFCYHTADAHGMNMIVKATDAACRHLVAEGLARRYYLPSGYCSEKRASGVLGAHLKGKRVTAGARLPRGVVRAYLHATPEGMLDLWHRTAVASLHAASLSQQGHVANGLTALFIACGQDVANVVNASAGITNMDVTDDGDLYASVTLPSLTVATVGGGTGQGTARECLAMLGCAGAGRARKFAEVVAATLLAGELSMAAAIASGEFVAAHEAYGRNRPGPAEADRDRPTLSAPRAAQQRSSSPLPVCGERPDAQRPGQGSSGRERGPGTAPHPSPLPADGARGQESAGHRLEKLSRGQQAAPEGRR